LYAGAATGAPTLLAQIPAKAMTPATCGYVTGDVQNRAVAGAGDVDGNGYADVIIGGLYAVNGALTNAGAAHLVLGSAGGIMAHVDIPSPAPATSGQFGSAVGGVGPVTGVGTPPKSHFVVVGNGQIYRFTGTATTPVQNFASGGATTVTMRDPVRGKFLERGQLAALARTRRR
jgi:hypothetical protein